MVENFNKWPMAFFVYLPLFFLLSAGVWSDNVNNVTGHCKSFSKLYFIHHTFQNSKYQLFKTLRVNSRTTPFIFHQLVLYCISFQMLIIMMIVVAIVVIIIIYYLLFHYYSLWLCISTKSVSIGGFPVICTYQESPVLLTKKKEKNYFPWANKFKSTIKCSSYTFFPRFFSSFCSFSSCRFPLTMALITLLLQSSRKLAIQH